MSRSARRPGGILPSILFLNFAHAWSNDGVGIFSRRRTSVGEAASAASVGSPGDVDPEDRAKLLELAARSDLSVPCRLTHFWYCAAEEDARVAAANMREHGWRIIRLGRAVDGTGWAVAADQEATVLTESAVAQARRFFTGLALQVDGGEYDGWEAGVEIGQSDRASCS